MTLQLPAALASRRAADGSGAAGREVARLGQQEQADLRDVGAGGDVDQIILGLRIERIGAGESSSLP